MSLTQFGLVVSDPDEINVGLLEDASAIPNAPAGEPPSSLYFDNINAQNGAAFLYHLDPDKRGRTSGRFRWQMMIHPDTTGLSESFPNLMSGMYFMKERLHDQLEDPDLRMYGVGITNTNLGNLEWEFRKYAQGLQIGGGAEANWQRLAFVDANLKIGTVYWCELLYVAEAIETQGCKITLNVGTEAGWANMEPVLTHKDVVQPIYTSVAEGPMWQRTQGALRYKILYDAMSLDRYEPVVEP